MTFPADPQRLAGLERHAANRGVCVIDHEADAVGAHHRGARGVRLLLSRLLAPRLIAGARLVAIVITIASTLLGLP